MGSIFERRHVDLLIDAFVRGVAPRVADARLEIVGENRLRAGGRVDAALDDAPEDVRRRVRLRSYVDEATLHDLYARATVFAFLSEYEGFGLTPLEALAAGVAPIVLDTPVAREIYGEAVERVALGPRTREDLATRVLALLTRPVEREALLAKAPDVLSRYDWSRTAAATLAAIEEAAGAR
ncbi:MAG: glycosyltransferase [Vicinamibacterales bacterium]